jgi:hypothetical protein
VFQTSDSYCGRYPLDSLARRYDGIDRNSQRRLKALDALADLSTNRDLAATFRRALEELLDTLRAETADLDESGERYTVESAEDVATLRDRAVTAVETALDETTEPGLSRRELHDMAELVETIDGEIGPCDDREQVAVDWIRRDVGEYIYVEAVARATPGVSETVAGTLRD